MSNIDHERFLILEKIYDSPYITFESLENIFPDCHFLADILNELEIQNYISFRVADSPSSDQGYCCQWVTEHPHLRTTASGNAIVEQERRHQRELDEKLRPLWAQADRIGRIAESASEQADSAQKLVNTANERVESAKKEAESARKDSAFSKFVSIASALISIAAIIVTALCG